MIGWVWLGAVALTLLFCLGMTLLARRYPTFKAQIATAGPDDVVIITFNRTLTAQEAERIKDRLASLAPQTKLAVVDQVGSAVVRKVNP